MQFHPRATAIARQRQQYQAAPDILKELGQSGDI